jgi:hypothetical protein
MTSNCFTLSKLRSLLALGAILASLVASSRSFAQSGYVYMTDYGPGDLLRYNYTYSGGAYSFSPSNTAGGGVTTSAILVSGAGMAGGIAGTRNDLIIATQTNTALARYTFDGTLINNITVNNGTFTGSATGSAQTANATHTFSNIGDIMISDNGRYLYVAGGSSVATHSSYNGIISKIDLTTDKIVAQQAMQGAQAIFISKDQSTIYVGNEYGSTGQAMVKAFDANLSTAGTQLAGYASTTSASGSTVNLASIRDLAVVGSKLYMLDQDSGVTRSQSTMAIATVAGTGASITFSSATTADVGATTIENYGGMDIGLDNNLYIAGIGSGKLNATSYTVSFSYVNGIKSFNTSTNAEAAVTGLNGYNNSNSTTPASGLASPVFIQFSSTFASTNDQGTPEPGALALPLPRQLLRQSCIGSASRRWACAHAVRGRTRDIVKKHL